MRPATSRLVRRLPATARRALRRMRRAAASTPPASRGSATQEDRRAGFLARLARQAPIPVHRAGGAPRVATACIPALAAGLEPEWDQRPLSAERWQEELGADGAAPPGAVLLQWTGGRVPGLPAEEVAGLLRSCESRGVPVLLWATDSTDLPWPEGHPVAGATTLFADDATTAARWSRASGRDVGHLPPAAHPVLHSPARTAPTRRRRRAVAVVLPRPTAGLLAPFSHLPPGDVDVWPLDRGPQDVPGDSPAPPGGDPAAAERVVRLLTESVVGRAPAGPSPTVGHYPVGVFLGAAAGASWQVVEASMAGTPLVLDAAAHAQVPADLAAVHTLAGTAEELGLDAAARLWQSELTEREGLVAARAARAHYHLGERADRLAAAAGLPARERDRSVSVVVPTNRAHELDNVAANLARQHELGAGRVQLVLVLHGVDLAPAEVRARFADAGVDAVEVVPADSTLTLGACMNLGVDAADGRYVAKVDDDNFYGRHYLTDLLDALEYSGAGIVGKWCHYVWLRASGAVVLRFPRAEHRFERLVQGGSIVFDGDVVRTLRFSDIPRAVDTDILDRAKDADVRTFSADRFNFVSIRGSDRFAHTWPITDTALMNRAGRLEFFGDPRLHVDI